MEETSVSPFQNVYFVAYLLLLPGRVYFPKETRKTNLHYGNKFKSLDFEKGDTAL